MTITFVGHGYVGLVTACVFADFGNNVWVIGHTPEKLKRLQSGDPIIFEPGLKELLEKNIKQGRLHFTHEYCQAIPESEVVFIAVGTPPAQDGVANLSTVFTVAKQIGKNLKKKYTVVSCKSTVPVHTNRKIQKIIEKVKPQGVCFDVVSCPEFLREGSALQDTFCPDRVVLGSESQKAIDILLELHKPISGKRVITGLESAEIIKYASNSFLATKISFANLISFFCEKTGADVEEVLEGVGLDNRIGRIFLYPGVGYGGSCFPKDVLALIQTGEEMAIDMSLLKSVDKINFQAKEAFLKKILANCKEKTIAIWGLAFKANTDDIRFAPSLYIIEELLKRGFIVRVYDPEAMDNVRKIFKEKLTYCNDPYDAVQKAGTLIVLTEWNEFKQIDLQKTQKLMKQPILFDGRNIYNPRHMKTLGYTYYGVGRII